MKLTCSTTVCPDYLLPEALQLVRDAGFDSIELFRTWSESSPVHPDWSARRVREKLDETGITLSGLNIRNITGRKADSDERNLAYNLRQIEWDIHLARALRLSTANTKGGARTDEAFEDLIEGANTLLERVPDFTLNLGNHKGNRLEGLGDYRAVMPEISERARVLLDTGHLLAAGEDIMPFAEAFPERIGLVHLRDQQLESHWSIPIEGSSAFAVSRGFALFAGGYDKRDDYHLFELSGDGISKIAQLTLTDENGNRLLAEWAIARSEALYIGRNSRVYRCDIQTAAAV